VKPTVIAGLLFVTAALVLYSLGAWGAFRKKGASKRDLIFLWAGLAGDLLGTLMMSIQSTADVAAKAAGTYMVTFPMGDTTLILENNLKTYLALAEVGLMLAVIIAAGMALMRKNDKLALLVSRAIFAPWALFVVVYIMGMKRG
jgi:hypothetical protein